MIQFFRFVVAVFLFYNVSAALTEPRFGRYTQQNYNFVELVQNAALQIKANKVLKESLNSPINMNSFPDDLKSSPSQMFDELLPDLLRNKTSEKCVKDLLYTFQNIASPWAAKMIDSYGKPESGILLGNFKWLGEFNECLSVYAPAKGNTSTGNFHGQYCSLTVTMDLKNMSLPLSLGTCLPDSCNLPVSINPQWEQMTWQSEVSPLVEERRSNISEIKLACQLTSRKLTTEAIAVICLISFFILLAVIGSSITAFEYFFKPSLKLLEFGPGYGVSSVNDDGEAQSLGDDGSEDDDILLLGGEREYGILATYFNNCKPFFNCFCIFTNGAKLLDTSISEKQLPCLHGIRFLSLCWVMVCHTYGFSFSGIRNLADVPNLIDNRAFMIILNGFFSVDSFFLLSGFLVAYIFFEQSSKSNGNIPWIYFYVHRFVRLTPVYMIVIAIYTTLYSYFASGPFWVNYDTEPVCHKNWWWNLLYINNFQQATEQCMAWSWYLANDMQFFVVSPIILITLKRWPKIGFSVWAAFLSATILSNIIVTYKFNLMSGITNIASIDNMQDFLVRFMDFFNYLYVRPYTRMGPYLIGILLAYILHKRVKHPVPAGFCHTSNFKLQAYERIRTFIRSSGINTKFGRQLGELATK
ncbi:hypothetical protein JTE90_023508 [Oedothorax gibbosus]|uniref:Nose resistant-to-fluoxetine protein N-terminal domain-containing protein n=1 Tax=Oedothorax gibbosus TaxID=931172 RepID=A0AAV6VRP6_9ARAC|nr:hypothetical protein JTE90_023508 [Oedothorax gibbosus]